MSDITLGIIGSGQLGSLLCQAAKKLNIKTVIISDDQQGPAQNYSDQFIFAKYDNKDKINNLVKKNINTFSLELLPRITRAQSMDILSSQANLARYKAVIQSFANF